MSRRERPVVALVTDAIYPYFRGGKELRYHEVAQRLGQRADVHVCTMHWWAGPAEKREGPVTFRAVCRLYPMYSGERRSYREAFLFAFACLLFAAASLLMTLQWLPGALAGALVVGACLPWVLVALFTLVQRRTPLALQGRVYSAFDTLIGLPQTISIAAGAGLIAFIDYRLLLVFSAVMGVLAAVYLLTRDEQRRVPTDVSGAPSRLPYAEAEDVAALPVA